MTVNVEEPHVLVVTGETEEEREWEVEHPDCPLICDWTPTMRATLAALWLEPEDFRAGDFDRDGRLLGRRSCYVQHELDNVGIDSLHGSVAGVTYEGGGHYNASTKRWESDGWRKIPPGRYIIRGWYVAPHWAGEYIDADGGLELLGREGAGERQPTGKVY